MPEANGAICDKWAKADETAIFTEDGAFIVGLVMVSWKYASSKAQVYEKCVSQWHEDLLKSRPQAKVGGFVEYIVEHLYMLDRCDWMEVGRAESVQSHDHAVNWCGQLSNVLFHGKTILDVRAEHSCVTPMSAFTVSRYLGEVLCKRLMPTIFLDAISRRRPKQWVERNFPGWRHLKSFWITDSEKLPIRGLEKVLFGRGKVSYCGACKSF